MLDKALLLTNAGFFLEASLAFDALDTLVFFHLPEHAYEENRYFIGSLDPEGHAYAVQTYW